MIKMIVEIIIKNPISNHSFLKNIFKSSVIIYYSYIQENYVCIC